MKKRIIAVLMLAVLALSMLAGCAEEEVQTITKQEAMQIALEDAGFEVTAVSGIHAHEGEQNGAPVYEIHFSVGETEYTYLIHGQTGEILSGK